MDWLVHKASEMPADAWVALAFMIAIMIAVHHDYLF